MSSDIPLGDYLMERLGKNCVHRKGAAEQLSA